MTVTLYDGLGMVGVALILLAYLGLQLAKLSPDSMQYSLLNAIGAALILVSLYFDFNLSAVVIESAWLLISVFGLYKVWRAKTMSGKDN